MKDGLYRVVHGSICAGFVVRGGEITLCAPVLRKKISFFSQIAEYVPTDTSIPPIRLSEGVFSSASDVIA